MIYDFVQSVNTVCVCVYYLLPCALAGTFLVRSQGLKIYYITMHTMFLLY